jgi:hypothetical protein
LIDPALRRSTSVAEPRPKGAQPGSNRRHRSDMDGTSPSLKSLLGAQKMRKAVEQWTDARLNDLADALEPVPAQVAVLDATVKHLDHLATALAPVPAQLAVLAATVDRLADENRALRGELAATQRQLLQIAWGLVAALLGAGAALIATLV